jgi:Methylase involved in ubiquinone/menaquinone biosynthesis
MNKQNQIIDDWNNSSDDYFRRWDYFALFNALEKDPYKGFPHTMAAIIKEYYPDLKGKNVCVPSCGDNVAVFGFCALGANVTATDISYKQIENAQKIAKERNLDIKYYLSDSMKLNELPDSTFDLVYTSNGVHVWIHDLIAMYGNINRILKNNGYYLMFDTHPFGRPFDKAYWEKGQFIIKKPYEEIGPFPDDTTFDWRTQDFVNSLIASGFEIKRMEEFHSLVEDFPNHNYLFDKDDTKHEKYDWHKNPYAALPQCLGLLCHKVGKQA